MRKFTLASLALFACVSCSTRTVNASEPPQVRLEVSTDSKIQNVLYVSVDVGGQAIREVTLTRQAETGSAGQVVVRKVVAAPFSFTVEDTVPGNGTYRYRVVALSDAYRTEAERQVTYTYTVGTP